MTETIEACNSGFTLLIYESTFCSSGTQYLPTVSCHVIFDDANDDVWQPAAVVNVFAYPNDPGHLKEDDESNALVEFLMRSYLKVS